MKKILILAPILPILLSCSNKFTRPFLYKDAKDTCLSTKLDPQSPEYRECVKSKFQSNVIEDDKKFDMNRAVNNPLFCAGLSSMNNGNIGDSLSKCQAASAGPLTYDAYKRQEYEEKMLQEIKEQNWQLQQQNFLLQQKNAPKVQKQTKQK